MKKGYTLIYLQYNPNVRVNNHPRCKVVQDGMKTLQTTALIQGRSLFDPFNQCVICQGSTKFFINDSP